MTEGHPARDAPRFRLDPYRCEKALLLFQEERYQKRSHSVYAVDRTTTRGERREVRYEDGLWRCSCPKDGALKLCHHQIVAYLAEGVLRPDQLPKPTVPYEDARRLKAQRPRPFGADARAEEHMDWWIPLLVRHASLQAPRLLDRPDGEPGRPRNAQEDSLVCAVLWAINQKNARNGRFHRAALRDAGILDHRVGSADVSRTLLDPNTTILLQSAIQTLAAPFANVDTPWPTPFPVGILGRKFAVDSTGFTPNRRGRYLEEKHRVRRKAVPWLKLHIGLSTKAKVVTYAEVTPDGNKTHDTTVFPRILDGTSRVATDGIEYVVGDGAYTNRPNVALVQAYGGTYLGPLRRDANDWAKGVGAMTDLQAFFTMHRDEFDAEYNDRSLAENHFASTKCRWGESLRSRRTVSQINETLARIVAMNAVRVTQHVHRLGVENEWWDRLVADLDTA